MIQENFTGKKDTRIIANRTLLDAGFYRGWVPKKKEKKKKNRTQVEVMMGRYIDVLT